ncbi:MAG: cache domain-containing protein [Candidatus Omnitrophota bacterium]
MQSKGVRLTLRVKLMAALLSLSIISIAAISYATFLSSSHFFKDSMVRSLQGITKLKAQAIENFIKDRIDQTEKTASSSDLVDNLDKVLSGRKVEVKVEIKAEEKAENKAVVDTKIEGAAPTAKVENVFEEVKLPESEVDIKKNKEKSAEYQALNKALLNLLGDGTKYEEVFILDTSGTVVASTVYENEEKTAQNAPFFINGSKMTFIQDPFISDITKKLTMVVATPIKDKNGKVIGVLGARLNLDKFYAIIKDETGLGATGETIVGKKIDNEIIFMAPTRYDEKAALIRKVTVSIGSGAVSGLQDAARGQDGFGLYLDYRGVESLAVWRPISILNWGMVVKVDAKEALRPILNTRDSIIILASILIFVIIVLSSYISKGVVGPIRELTEAAISISKGNTNVKIDIRSNDEVGDLAESFERMLAAIKFFKNKDKEDEK